MTVEERTKQRLVGVLVFVGALFVILPFLFHNSRPMADQEMASADKPVPAVSVALPDAATSPAVTAAAVPAAPTPLAANSPTTAPIPTPTPAPVAASIPTAAPPAAVAVNNTNNPAAPTPQPAVLSQNTPNTAPAPTAVPMAPASALTTGEADDQPAAIQKAAAEAVAQTPEVTTAATVEKTPTENKTAENKAEKNRSEQKVAARKPIHGWTIQVGVFSEKENAHHLVSRLHEAHFRAYSRAIHHEGHTLTAVFVGPERSLVDAKMAAQEIKMKLSLGGDIKDYRG